MNNIANEDTIAALKNGNFPDDYAAKIIKSIGVSGYMWEMDTDKIVWTNNFAGLMSFKAGVDFCHGRSFETLLSSKSPNTRFSTVSSMGTSEDSVNGVFFQCTYALSGDHLNSGEDVWIEDTGKWYPGPNGKPARVEGIVRITNERRKLEERLREKTDFDQLTSLPNKNFLSTIIERTAKVCFENETSAAFLCFNIERMELINEIYGYSVGDEVVCRVGEILKSKIRGDDFLARMSGSKFGMVLNNCNSSEVFIAAKRFLLAVEQEVFWSKHGPVALSGSVGSCMLPRHASTAEGAVEAAMQGLLAARRENGIKLGLYSPDPMADISQRDQINAVSRVIQAVQEGKMHLAFQPVVDANSHKVVFHEALIRMEDDTGYIEPSAAFVEVAEKLGLIKVVDRLALTLALDTLAQYPDARLSLNVSLNTAEDPNWISILASRLSNNEEMASRLIVEITESHAASDVVEVQKFVELVHGLGCKIAIDDFGAGYTSFANLRDLEFDWIKLDGSFCQDLLNNEQNQVFIQSLLALAKVHNAKTVVEWVDTAEIAALLASWGVDTLQGNSFGKPLSVAPWEKAEEDDVLPGASASVA